MVRNFSIAYATKLCRNENNHLASRNQRQKKSLKHDSAIGQHLLDNPEYFWLYLTNSFSKKGYVVMLYGKTEKSRFSQSTSCVDLNS